MAPRIRRRTTGDILPAVAATAAILSILLFLGTAASRLTYPFELEWLEGAALQHVRRLLDGAPLYIAPSTDFVPFGYPPLFYYVSAGVSPLFGDGFVALRAVSLASAVGCLVLIATMVRREADAWAGLLAAGFFAGTYGLADSWLDIGRPDSLFLFFTLAGVSWLARASTPRDCIVGGVWAALAFFTKQPVTIVLAPLAAWLLFRQPRALAWLALPFAAAAALTAAAHFFTSGWYSYYVFTLPRLRLGVSLDWPRLWLFWLEDVIYPMWPVLLLIAVALWRVGRAGIARHTRYLLLASGLVAASWLARLEGGAWANALLPACAAVSILVGLALAATSSRRGVTAGVVLLQFAVLVYDPRPLVPTAADEVAGRRIVAEIAAIHGEVLVLDHGYLGSLAGKRTFAHGWAMTDVMWADYTGAGSRLETEMLRRLARRDFTAIVVDNDPHWFAPQIEEHYPRARPISRIGQRFWPVAGARRRPEMIRY